MKKTREKIDFPILKELDRYILDGGRIEKRHGRICLINSDGDYIIGGKNTQEMLENLIYLMC